MPVISNGVLRAMFKVSVNILTKNRAALLRRALASVAAQNFTDFEVVVINDGSTDETLQILKDLKIEPIRQAQGMNLKIINHPQSVGITLSRQEALTASQGEYVAILDDDDEWIDRDKLKKQAEFLDKHPNCVLVGGGIEISNDKFQMTNEIPNSKFQINKQRPLSDSAIRNTMLFRNNFFTSTVMFRREAAIKAGGFIKDEFDFAEDYDLWLRLGTLGKMANFNEVVALYARPNYNKEKFRQFLQKQLALINTHRLDYPFAFFAKLLLILRMYI